MAFIALTDSDVHDLSTGATINALADDGTEHELGPADIGPGEIEALESGAELFIGDHRVSYPD